MTQISHKSIGITLRSLRGRKIQRYLKKRKSKPKQKKLAEKPRIRKKPSGISFSERQTKMTRFTLDRIINF